MSNFLLNHTHTKAGSAFPESPIIADVYVDPLDGTTYVYAGSSWFEASTITSASVTPTMQDRFKIVEYLVNKKPDYKDFDDFCTIFDDPFFVIEISSFMKDNTCYKDPVITIAKAISTNSAGERFNQIEFHTFNCMFLVVSEDEINDYWKPSDEVRTQIGLEPKYTISFDPASGACSTLTLASVLPSTITLSGTDLEERYKLLQEETEKYKKEIIELTKRVEIIETNNSNIWEQSILTKFTPSKVKQACGSLKAKLVTNLLQWLNSVPKTFTQQ